MWTKSPFSKKFANFLWQYFGIQNIAIIWNTSIDKTINFGWFIKCIPKLTRENRKYNLTLCVLTTLQFLRSIVISTVLYSGTSVQFSKHKNWKIWQKYELQNTLGIEKSIFQITLPLLIFLPDICHKLDKDLPYSLSSLLQPCWRGPQKRREFNYELAKQNTKSFSPNRQWIIQAPKQNKTCST